MLVVHTGLAYTALVEKHAVGTKHSKIVQRLHHGLALITASAISERRNERIDIVKMGDVHSLGGQQSSELAVCLPGAIDREARAELCGYAAYIGMLHIANGLDAARTQQRELVAKHHILPAGRGGAVVVVGDHDIHTAMSFARGVSCKNSISRAAAMSGV